MLCTECSLCSQKHIVWVITFKLFQISRKKKDFYVIDVVVAHEDHVEDVAVKVGVEVWSTLRFDCGLFVTRQLLWDSRATKPAKITGLTMDLKWPWESLASLQKIYNFLSLLYWEKTSLQIFSVHTFVVFSMFGLLNCFVWVTNMIIDKICVYNYNLERLFLIKFFYFKV